MARSSKNQQNYPPPGYNYPPPGYNYPPQGYNYPPPRYQGQGYPPNYQQGGRRQQNQAYQRRGQQYNYPPGYQQQVHKQQAPYYDDEDDDAGSALKKTFSVIAAPFRFVGFAAKSIFGVGKKRYLENQVARQNAILPFQEASYDDALKNGEYVCIRKGVGYNEKK